jgi:hypothetical protein
MLICSKIVLMDTVNCLRHQAELDLRHLMQMLNYFVNSFYSVGSYSFKVAPYWSVLISSWRKDCKL